MSNKARLRNAPKKPKHRPRSKTPPVVIGPVVQGKVKKSIMLRVDASFAEWAREQQHSKSVTAFTRKLTEQRNVIGAILAAQPVPTVEKATP